MRVIRILSIVAMIAIVAVGCFHAFSGANDFAVFYEAWKSVLSGNAQTIFDPTLMPDRFLYAPGFAFLLAPLAFFPKTAALALWCDTKALAIGFLLYFFLRLESQARKRAVRDCFFAFVAFVIVARPILIDLQYGQVNIFILVAASWALYAHIGKNERLGAFLSWFVLGVLSASKLLTLPLLLVPFLSKNESREKAKQERFGAIAGVVFILILPFLFQGWHGGIELLQKWMDALHSRGFPTESHNQSLVAALYRYLSDQPTHVIAWGWQYFPLGYGILSVRAIHVIGTVWTIGTLAGIIYFIRFGSREKGWLWLSILLGAVILPPYLVWKTYFIFTFPLAFAALIYAEKIRKPWAWALVGVCAVALNFTGIDFVGVRAAGLLESASILFLAHCGLLALALRASSDVPISQLVKKALHR